LEAVGRWKIVAFAGVLRCSPAICRIDSADWKFSIEVQHGRISAVAPDDIPTDIERSGDSF
jgi:hypothetical protein